MKQKSKMWTLNSKVMCDTKQTIYTETKSVVHHMTLTFSQCHNPGSRRWLLHFAKRWRPKYWHSDRQVRSFIYNTGIHAGKNMAANTKRQAKENQRKKKWIEKTNGKQKNESQRTCKEQTLTNQQQEESRQADKVWRKETKTRSAMSPSQLAMHFFPLQDPLKPCL